jgi:hypothetical protein
MLSRKYSPNQRLSTKCMSAIRQPTNRVFDWNDTKTQETDIEVIREAYYTCHILHGKYKEACYLSYGLDANNVDYYYPIVEKLEREYTIITLDHTKKCIRFRLGKYEISIRYY